MDTLGMVAIVGVVVVILAAGYYTMRPEHK
jgi:hypothetical protein